MEKYTTMKELGKGGFGTAELVERKTDKMLFVIKTMKIGGDEKKRNFAEREVEILRKARHYNVVRLHEYMIFNDEVRIVLAYCDGGDLNQAIRQQSLTGACFSEKKVLDWMIQLLYGLKYLHGIGVMHRDLKPANLLLFSDQRRLLIADFGLSRIVKRRGLAETTGIGTIYYMAPELFGENEYTAAVDIWAIGCIVYKVVNLSEAFFGSSEQIVMYKIVHSTYNKPRRRFCADIIEKCLKKDGAQRSKLQDLIDLVDDKIEQKTTIKEGSKNVRSAVETESTSCTKAVVKTGTDSEQSSDQTAQTNSGTEVKTVASRRISLVTDKQVKPEQLSEPTSCSEVDAPVDEDPRSSSGVSSLDMSNFRISVAKVPKHHGNYPNFLWINDANFCSFGHFAKNAYFTEMTSQGHSTAEIGQTTCASMRSHGTVVTGDKHGQVNLWFNGQNLKTRKLHHDCIWQVCGLTGNRTFTASEDGRIKILGQDFETIEKMEGSKKQMNAIANHGNTVATGDNDGIIWYYDLNSASKPKILNGHSDTINSLAFKSDLLASGSGGHTIKLWRPKELDQPILTMKHERAVTNVVFGQAATENKLFSCSFDSTTAIWNVETGHKLNSIKHPNYARCLDIHPNGYLAATGHTKGVSLSDLRAPLTFKEIEGKDTFKVKFSPSGNRLGITEDYCGVKICDIRY